VTQGQRILLKKNGDISVELDALPPNVLDKKVKESLNDLIIDQAEWELELRREADEREQLINSLQEVWGE